jgi:hypothetical protein
MVSIRFKISSFPASAFLAMLALLPGPRVFAAHHAADDSPPGALFQADGLQFVVPAKWIAEPAESPARAGQWRVTALRGTAETSSAADEGEVVVFSFGSGLGGTPQENIAAWKETIRDSAGHPATAEVKTRVVAGFKISEWVAFGSYNDPVPIPGMPPVVRPDYGLAAAVIETPQGSLYWRLTGPEPLVTATLPLFRKMLDGVKPQGAG